MASLPIPRPVPEPLAGLWVGLYDCPLWHRCSDVRFDPSVGLVPRGIWAPPSLERVELLVVAHNPGAPRPGEQEAFRSALAGLPRMELANAYTYHSFVHGSRKPYHARLMRVLSEALADGQPLPPRQVLDRVVLTNLVKCALRGGAGAQARPVTLTTCTSAYLAKEVAALTGVPVLAVGEKSCQWAMKHLPAGGWTAMPHPSYRQYNDGHHKRAVGDVRRLLRRTGPTMSPSPLHARSAAEPDLPATIDEVVAVSRRLSRGARTLPAWLTEVRTACAETLKSAGEPGELEATSKVQYMAVRPARQSRRNWVYLVAAPDTNPDTIEIRFVVPFGSRVARAAAAALRSTYEVALVNPEDRSDERLAISVGVDDQARLEALRQWARPLYAEFCARWLQ